MKYKVLYHNIEIGLYEQKEDIVKYTVNKEGLNQLKEQDYDPYKDLIEDYEGNSFPLFDNRIRNCSRFPNTEIGYHTDPITLVKIEEGE